MMSNQKNENYENAITIRKQVTGEAHVERIMSQVTEFTVLLLPLKFE